MVVHRNQLDDILWKNKLLLVAKLEAKIDALINDAIKEKVWLDISSDQREILRLHPDVLDALKAKYRGAGWRIALRESPYYTDTESDETHYNGILLW